MNVATWLFVLAAGVTLTAVEGRKFHFKNNYGQTIWVGALGNAGKGTPNNGGWEMSPGAAMEITVDDSWGGRFWGRTGCNFGGGGGCETGDCGRGLHCNGAGGRPPATLAEFTLSGYGGQDFYDVSNVDGFNLPLAIETVNKQGGGDQYRCNRAACTADINGQCPGELRLTVNGRTVGCKSACEQFNTDQYCCRGQHNRPETCRSSDWPNNYPAFFKGKCPDAYSYAYDDHKSTFTCDGTDYRITFG